MTRRDAHDFAQALAVTLLAAVALGLALAGYVLGFVSAGPR